MRKLILTLCFCLIASVVHADYYYLGQWEWVDNGEFEYWTAPYSEYRTGNIDLRSIPQMSKKGGVPEGYAIFSYSQTIRDKKMLYLGNDKEAVLSKSVTDTLKDRLGIEVSPKSIKNMIYEILTTKADSTGKVRWKPLMPDKNLKMKVYLGTEGNIKEVALIPYVSPEWETVLAVIHEDYRRLVHKSEHIKVSKWLDFNQEKYGVDYNEFIPDDEPIKLSPLPHNTTITDDFDRASLGADWSVISGTWGIRSNEVLTDGKGATWPNRIKNTNALSSDDHYVQIDFTNDLSSSNAFLGPMARWDDSLQTYYWGCIRAGGDIRSYSKVIEGVGTNLDGDTNGSGPPQVVKIQCNGSTIKFYDDGTEIFSVTDTGITGNTKTGLAGHTSNDALGDDFIAADLAAVTARRRMWIQ